MKKMVDLIIPYYNSCKTLERLFASIVLQSVKEKINVILVNDCSTDDFQTEINKYKDLLQITVVNLEKNSGPGTARREGYLKGTSPFVMYIDADDTFQNPFAVQELLTHIKNEKCDAVNSIFLAETKEGRFIPQKYDWIWTFGKIYRRSFLEKHNILMNDTRANEDTGYNTVISAIGKISSFPDNTYTWHYKEDSITRRDNSIYTFIGVNGWVDNMIWATQEILRIKPDFIISDLLVTCMMSLYTWYNEFTYSTDERIDLVEYKSWCNRLYKAFEKLYKEFDFELYQAPFLVRDCKVSPALPKITFEQFLYEVGEGYGK